MVRLALLFALVAGCVEVRPPPPAESGHPPAAPSSLATTPGPGEMEPETPSPVAHRDRGQGETGAARSCTTWCDCPQGEDCINAVCVRGERPIYCCTNPDCPAGEPCWRTDHTSSLCSESPTPAP